MNNRIFELIQEQNGCKGLDWTEGDKKEFAEFIVKECLMIVYERQEMAPTDDDGYFKVALDMVSKDIEQHFGVEE
jgi:hypothetical protein